MSISIHRTELYDLLRGFHTLTGIKIVLFDTEYREILSYPETHSTFCRLMNDGAQTKSRCQASNIQSFKSCQKSGELTIYHCHAGLLEVTAPISDSGVLLGYIMFGQISDASDGKDFVKAMVERAPSLGIGKIECIKAIAHVASYSSERVNAAAKILEACICYVLRNDLVSLRKGRLVKRIEEYISTHLDQKLTADDLCSQFHLSRSGLYRLFADQKGDGVMRVIRSHRLRKACEFMGDRNLSLHQIAVRCGFDDYSHFCRTFRKGLGLSPKLYREKTC